MTCLLLLCLLLEVLMSAIFPPAYLLTVICFSFISLHPSLCPVCGSVSQRAVMYVGCCCSHHLSSKAFPRESSQVR